ncbi:MAG: transposase domain-containing protein [Lewinellaceae bacterium]|nr:transposase domain-containing protein [Lewinellaceae bacterium]
MQHDVEPNQWLNDVLNRIHSHPINKITELLPQYWRQNPGKTPE